VERARESPAQPTRVIYATGLVGKLGGDRDADHQREIFMEATSPAKTSQDL
jgi:hypothetical protein